MSAVAGAAVAAFSSLDSAARCNVAVSLSVHSSPSPISSKNLNISGRSRYTSHSRGRIAEAKASTFSIDSDDEEPVYGYEGAEDGRKNVTWRSPRQESSSEARISGASHDEGNLSWMQKQQISGVNSFDIHKARGKNAHASQNHARDNAIAYNKGRDFLPFEEQQHHVSSMGKKHPRVPLPTKNQHLRTHNKISVFEGIKQPSISGLSSNNRTDASSWGVDDADIAPNFNRQSHNLYEYSRHRLKYSQLPTQQGIKENIQRGAKFMSKLEEVLLNIKKKDVLSSTVNQEALRDENTLTQAGQGVRTATSDGKKAEESGVLGSSNRNEKRSAKSVDFDSARDANIPIARDDSRGFPLVNDGKGLQSEPGEARALLKEKARVDNEAGVTSFNLFSSSPSVPWEADRKYASMLKPRIPIRRGSVSTLARRSFTSIGSRSSPSRPSANSRNVSYSKIDTHAATGVVDPSKLLKGDDQMESWFENRVGIELNDDKFTTQIASQKGAPKAEEQVESINFDRSESDAEKNGDNALSKHSKTEEIATKANAPTKSKLSAASSHSIVDWDNSDSKVNEDNTFSIDLDVVDDVPPELDSIERSHHNKENSVYSIDSDVEAAKPPEFDSSEGSLHNKKEILSSSMTNTYATTAVFPMDTILGASETGSGSNHSNSASWHKHSYSDLPFEFQFSYSETPKAPILGYRETPYCPFGPSTMGRPWTGGPPPKPSKKKKRVFDSFNPPPKDKKGVKFVQDPGPFPEGQGPKPAKSREEIMGEPLTKEEIIYLVEKCERESRQLNLGRDGLTHNMLDLIHCHWKRRRVCKIKCKGVPTVDMDNVKFHIEDKTGGKIIYQAGGVLYLFRGRNYNYKDRPQIPLMLWKPVTPLYPKLIQPAPEGVTKEEAQRLRVLGRKVQPICRLGKNGVYLNLVKDVRDAFKLDELVRIDCQGLNPRDYKKIGAKLKDLVPCILLSFDKEHILMWKGKQDLSVVNRSLSRAPNFEPCLAGEEILKRSYVTDEGNDHRICNEKVNDSVDEASYSDHASEGETEDNTHQSYFEQESGSVLDFASHEVLTHSSDAEVTSLPQIAKEQVQFHRANIDETFLSSSSMDEGHAFTHTRETNYASNYQSLKEENIKLTVKEINLSQHEFSKISSMSDEIHLDTTDNLSERLATTDRKLQRETESEGIDSVGDGHKDSVPKQAAASKESFIHEVENGLASHGEVVNECLDDQTNSVMRLDALWDHAFASGMAVELPQEGMDADVIVRKAAQLAQFAPLGPTYTTKLMYKLRFKRGEDRPDDILQIRFGRGKPQKIPKKVVKRKFQLPTLDVPGMGGLPVDELARLLAPKQTL